MYEVILKRFENPDEVRTFEKGKFELVHVGGMTIGRASYEPGWKWSVHVGAAQGLKNCSVEHVGMVVSGRATAAMDDGRVVEMKAGTLYPILHKLEKEGWVRCHWESDTGRKRKWYELTATGRKHLKSRADEWWRYVDCLRRILGPRPEAHPEEAARRVAANALK